VQKEFCLPDRLISYRVTPTMESSTGGWTQCPIGVKPRPKTERHRPSTELSHSPWQVRRTWDSQGWLWTMLHARTRTHAREASVRTGQ
jgi:hypothetical protein